MKYLSGKLSKTDIIIFAALIILTLLGVALTNVSPSHAHKYWLAMILFFAIGAIATGWQRATEKGQKKQLITSQLLHWGSTLVAVIVVYTFLHTGQIQNETVSLMILLILALSSFLDGFHVGWHFSVLGILLAISVVTISYIEEFMWVITIIAVILLALSFFWNKYKKHSME